ncbi:holo-ACP synthase [Campylobacter sputorum]|uniref:holo-ACP synthase n=1 Tax=Campylobacter sputorum TaxID=206 RepID=UPI00053BFB4B|nr:holo-ACP synthase [Campylobacter sputorum]
MIGIDIIAIKRISDLKLKYGDKFLYKFLNKDEINIAKSEATMAGFFAAKEAFAKALGCGISKEFSFHDVEIYKDSNGAPLLKIAQKIKSNFDIQKASLSISHDGGFAIAAVILQKK